MMNQTQRNEIEKVIQKLNINRKDFHEVGKTQWQNIVAQTIQTFVAVVDYQNRSNLHWAWLHFKEPVESIAFSDDSAHRHLLGLIEEDYVWFIVEDTFDKMWVYEAKAELLTTVLSETPYCEYYIVSRKFDWLLCENHHGMLFALGKNGTEKLAELKHFLVNNTAGKLPENMNSKGEKHP